MAMMQRRSRLRRLAPCVALTVAAHAAVLALPVRPAATAGVVSPVTTMHVRTIEAPHPVALPVVDAVAPAKTAMAEPVVRAAHESPRNVAARLEVRRVDLAQRAEPSSPLPSAPGWSLHGAADEDDAFLARSLLAVPPAPLAPVLITYPDVAGLGGRYTSELTLFIDEAGAVVRVRAEAGALPPALEEAARTAFMSVRFRPGELAEQVAVKSRIRVEVVFEGGAPLLSS
jgi:hypothetical protein